MNGKRATAALNGGPTATIAAQTLEMFECPLNNAGEFASITADALVSSTETACVT